MKKWQVCAFFLFLMVTRFLPALSDSWSQINRAMERKMDWQRIVDHSAFALGDVYVRTLENGKTYTERSFGTYPSIDGSTVMVPMAMEFARQHLGLPEAGLTGFVAFSTTHNAYLNLIYNVPNGSAALIMEESWMDALHPVDLFIGTEPSDEELALAREHGVTLIKKPVCYDAFVFITHATNSVQSVSLDDIRAIYRGEITNWMDLGGNDAKIDAYQRDQNSGSQTAMENMVMEGESIFSNQPVGIYHIGDMSSLVDKVGGYKSTENGIGYTFKYYIDELYRDDSIKMLAIDGVYPSEENIRSGVYPLTVQYYGVIREGDEEKAGGLFLDWILTGEGQRCIQQAGYIPYASPEM